MEIATFEKEKQILGFYLLKKFEIKVGKTNKEYADLTLEDKTATINAKIWNTEGLKKEDYDGTLVVKVKGKVTEFNGALQLNIEKIRPLKSNDGIALEDLIPTTPIKADEMYREIRSFVKEIEDKEIVSLINKTMKHYEEKLLYYPAAKSNHHSIKSGLLYHILRMLRSAKALKTIYKEINLDLLYAGIILHDIAKIDEMNSNELGIVSEYSVEGELLGHIIIGINLIYEFGKELRINKEKIMLLEHMLLSHHYEPEYGSPKKPYFLEAEILHHLDMIDARIYDINKAVKEVEPGGFSEPVFSLDRRRIYKPKI